MIAEWHQNQVAAWKTEIGCHPRPLRANGTFGHLHNYVRAHRINARYVFYGDSFSRPLVASPIDFFNAAVKRRRNRIPKMKECVFFEADVNKHRLQSHFDVFDFALVNATDDVPRALTLDAIFLQPAVLE